MFTNLPMKIPIPAASVKIDIAFASLLDINDEPLPIDYAISIGTFLIYTTGGRRRT